MDEYIKLILQVISGICWTIVYIILIIRGFKDKTYGMPFYALALNFMWELLYSINIEDFYSISLQRVINVIWLIFDILIIYTYFKYGKKYFNQNSNTRDFYIWSTLGFTFAFFLQYAFIIEIGGTLGAAYAAFIQNFIMSILFLDMLQKRGNLEGQSIYIAIFKTIGTLAPTILFTIILESPIVLVLGIGCFVYDFIYIIQLRKQFIDKSLNPFTRKIIKK